MSAVGIHSQRLMQPLAIRYLVSFLSRPVLVGQNVIRLLGVVLEPDAKDKNGVRLGQSIILPWKELSLTSDLCKGLKLGQKYVRSIGDELHVNFS